MNQRLHPRDTSAPRDGAERAGVAYVLGPDDRILLVRGHWEEFALANGARELVEGVVGRKIWDFIVDRTTRHLYGVLFDRARAGATLEVPFRCDSPAERRFMRLRMEPLAPDRVEVTTRLEASEGRPTPTPRPTPKKRSGRAPAPPLEDETLRMCGWCNAVPVEGVWMEVEDAVDALGLFDATELPPVSHGMCPDCEQELDVEG